MDTNALARRLSAIGREEAAHMRRLSAIGREEAAHMRALARIQKERCKLLCEGVALHGADLGLSEGVTAEVVAPKDE